MIVPLAIYLARCYAQRRWIACALVLSIGAVSTVSRTGIVMFVVIGLVYLWLRPARPNGCGLRLVPALIVIHFAVPGTLGSIKNSFMPTGWARSRAGAQAGQSGSGRLADLGPGIRRMEAAASCGPGLGHARGLVVRFLERQRTSWTTSGSGRSSRPACSASSAGSGSSGGAVRRFGREAKQDDGPRGWLLASITASVAAYAVGMVTYDAFSFIQVTFLLFILVGLGTALIAEQPVPRPSNDPYLHQQRSWSPVPPCREHVGVAPRRGGSAATRHRRPIASAAPEEAAQLLPCAGLRADSSARRRPERPRPLCGPRIMASAAALVAPAGRRPGTVPGGRQGSWCSRPVPFGRGGGPCRSPSRR